MKTSLIPRRSVTNLKVSVIVPCHSSHVARLPELMQALECQTRIPDEVVIAVSGCTQDKVPYFTNKIAVTILHRSNNVSAGANRNRAAVAAQGDVLICHDADDLSHPQRVEIIAGLFEKYEVDHLMHFFYYLKSAFTAFSFDQALSRSSYRNVISCRNISPKPVPFNSGRKLTQGNVAVMRNIVKRVQWTDCFSAGEDTEFNREVYKIGKRTVITELPLITYRRQFSTFTRGISAR